MLLMLCSVLPFHAFPTFPSTWLWLILAFGHMFDDVPLLMPDDTTPCTSSCMMATLDCSTTDGTTDSSIHTAQIIAAEWGSACWAFFCCQLLQLMQAEQMRAWQVGWSDRHICADGTYPFFINAIDELFAAVFDGWLRFECSSRFFHAPPSHLTTTPITIQYDDRVRHE